MPDEPTTATPAASDPTPAPEPAPAAEPAAAPAVAAAPAAEPAAAPAAEPAAAPAAPAGAYPVEEPKGPKGVASSHFNGQAFEMTQSQLDQVVHEGLTALQQRGQQQPAAPAQPEPGSEEEVTRLRNDLSALQQQVNASSYESRLQNETSRLNQALDAEVLKHEVFKDNPDLSEVGRKSALALLNHNPRMSEVDAMKKVANDFGKALNAKKDQWVRGKMSDAASAEAGPGGEPTASPTSKPLTGNDLMRGKVRDQAMRRLGATQLTQ